MKSMRVLILGACALAMSMFSVLAAEFDTAFDVHQVVAVSTSEAAAAEALGLVAESVTATESETALATEVSVLLDVQAQALTAGIAVDATNWDAFIRKLSGGDTKASEQNLNTEHSESENPVYS